jgi:hypothetical protein
VTFNYVYGPEALDLVPTASKTSNYTASVNDFVIVDGTSGSPVITLPTAPPNLACVGVKRLDATYTRSNIPTIAVGGSDAFLGGSTAALQLPLQGQVSILQYDAPLTQWIVRSTDEPLSGLDSRYLSGAFTPDDHGWIAWNYDPIIAAAGGAPTAGFAYFMLLPIRKATTITNLIMYVQTAGVTLTSGQNLAGLFDSGGNLLSATASQHTAWQTTGLKTMALGTPQSVAAGLYYIGFFVNGSTVPQFAYDASANPSNGGNSGIVVPRFAVDGVHSGLTTAFVSPAVIAAWTIAFWGAVS